MFQSKRSSKTTSSRRQPTPVAPSSLRDRVTRSENGRETRNQMIFYSQLLGLVRSGFDRIEATLRLGLGINEPAARITELEAQVARLTEENTELRGTVVTLANGPDADDQAVDGDAPDEPQAEDEPAPKPEPDAPAPPEAS